MIAALYALTVSADSDDNSNSARVQLQNASGERVGEARLSQKKDAIEVSIEVEGLTPGFHGFHVHANNDPSNGTGCEGPAFASADGHYKDTEATHANHSSHNGDMPVLLVKAAGKAEARFMTDRFTVEEVIGRVIIVHAGPDNYANIPALYLNGAQTVIDPATTLATGDAGGRAVCGVIETRARGD